MTITAISRDWGTEPAIVRISSSATLATVVTANYISGQADNIAALNAGPFKWLASDTVLVYASDGWGFYNISSDFSSLESFFSASSIDDGSITLAKLATGIAPSHVVKFAAEHTTVGGGAAEAITVNGVLATDLVFAQLHTEGATPRTVLTAVASADTVTITFSGDPSNDHVVTYQVLRAAA